MSRNSWATPMPIYLAMDHEFDFVADICASERNAKHPCYLTEQDDTLNPETMQRLASLVPAGNYVWCNPPYSDIGPWVTVAIALQNMGIGVVMLVMADNSVGWYAKAIEFCQEVREVIKGRIAFIHPETGESVKGNNKGSLLFVFDPYGRKALPRRTYVARDELLATGHYLMTEPGMLFPLSTELESQSTEQPAEPEPLSAELIEEEIEPTDFTPVDLYHLWINGELHADSFNHFIAALVVMFGRLPAYSVRQTRMALVAETADSDNHVTISGLERHQCMQIGAFGRALGRYDVTQAESMADAVAELVARNAMKDTSIIEVINQFKRQQEAKCSTE